MPRRHLSVCAYPGCPELTIERRCPSHQTEADKPWAGSTRGKATASRAWRRLRLQILERDQSICHICRQPGADTVDHLTPVSQGGTDDPANLAAVHDRTPPHCHRRKTNTERRR